MSAAGDAAAAAAAAGDDVLVTLALGHAEPVDDVTLARARRALRAPGGLARGYRVLDDAGALCCAAGVDDASVARSPLARLLEEELRRAPSAARALGQRAWPALAAAAALLAFVIVRDDGERGTKGGASLPSSPVAIVSVRSAAGPLGTDGVVRGLEPRADALGRCSAGRAVVDVRFRVRGDGLVEGAVASSAARSVADCVAGVVEGTAFALHDDATDVDAAIELHPEAR